MVKKFPFSKLEVQEQRSANLDCCLFFQGFPAKNGFHIFSAVGEKKTQKNNIL